MFEGDINIINIGVCVNGADLRLAQPGCVPPVYIYAFSFGISPHQAEVLRRRVSCREAALSGVATSRVLDVRGVAISAPSSYAPLLH